MEDKIVEFKIRGKIKKKLLSKEAQALKLIRINKKITREAASHSVEITKVNLERYENGMYLMPDLIQKRLLRRYKVSHAEFAQILNDEVELLDLPAHSVHKRIGEGNYIRRFDSKKITKEVRVLKIMRAMNKMSQSQAGAKCGVHRRSIGHIENGRVDITDTRLEMLLKAYSFTKDEFLEMVEEDILRDEVIQECIEILKTIEKDKLRAVSALLINFK